MFLSKLQEPYHLAYAQSRSRNRGLGEHTSRTKSGDIRLCWPVGGNVALLLFLLQNAIRLRADLLAMHMGEPERQIPLALEMWIFYAPFSFVGWLLVGVPIALLFPARSIKRLSWTLRVCRRCSWPTCPVLDLRAAQSRSHPLQQPGTFTGTSSLWAFSILVSTVSFVLYMGLLRDGS